MVSVQYRGQNFYPRSPCGERPPLADGAEPHAAISIHALLAESDAHPISITSGKIDFYPRSPCGERPLFSLLCNLLHYNFYPRSPCGERRCRCSCTAHNRQFLSTLSLRRATLVQIIISGYARISIHALLAESDKWLYLFL